MQIKECAYFMNESLIGTPAENCNLFPEKNTLSYRFIECEQVPISKCPYKQFVLGMIDKEDLNKKINEVRRHNG